MLDLIIVRILPTQPRTADDFANDLKGLTITAYDLTIDKSNPANVGVFLGTAQALVPRQSQAVHNFAKPLTLTTDNTGFAQSIMQHWDIAPLARTFFEFVADLPYPDDPNYASVATAVIVVNRPASTLEFPNDNSYDLRFEVRRTIVKEDKKIIDHRIDDAIIEYNATVYSVTDIKGLPGPCTQAYYMGYRNLSFYQYEWLGVPFGSDWPIIPSAYISIPPAPPIGSLDVVAVDVADGQIPAFDDVLVAINDVLAREFPQESDGNPHTLQLNDPLTSPQCQHIASQLIWDRVRYPAPSPSVPLEKIYTQNADIRNNQDQGTQDQRKWEGSVLSYHWTHDAEALILSKFIFAASAAVYAEKQSSKKSTAVLTVPIIGVTPTPTALNHVNVLLEKVDHLFVVPAAYFYALASTQTTQITAAVRYHNPLGYDEDRLTS